MRVMGGGVRKSRWEEKVGSLRGSVHLRVRRGGTGGGKEFYGIVTPGVWKHQ